MKKILVFLLALVMSVSCTLILNQEVIRGNGKMAEQSYDIYGFDGIVVNGAMDVVYSQGPENVVLHAEENLLEYYDVEVIDGSLVVRQRCHVSLVPRKSSVLVVSSPDLRKIKVSGSGDCAIKGGLVTGGDFSFSISGSGDLDADSITCDNLYLRISGAGDIDIDSATANVINGSISGSGDMDIHCKDAGAIVLKISGSGDIELSGNAKSLSHKISGAGHVNARELLLD
ncbi:MAG: DUF2807 domain-containing protein [Bacteroidales bacterium]|jgi:hypothetical protein|nr:DUF2807 domain-containing protein [Bacteroidales bacterium]